MLARILTLLGDNPAGLPGGVIARAVGRDPSAVAGMLGLLMDMGEIEPVVSETACSSCPIAAFCDPDDCDLVLYIRRQTKFRIRQDDPTSSRDQRRP